MADENGQSIPSSATIYIVLMENGVPKKVCREYKEELALAWQKETPGRTLHKVKECT